ncbi:MAG: cupin-like domain-containing protein [Acidobacteriia bacterium]|nr:cupin-like domain-containing protein [Terriglobia bacterium]
MSESGNTLARVTKVTVETFVSEYLRKNQPVIVTDAMRDWEALKRWTPDHLSKRFGHEQVQVYGDLFRLVGITSLSEYLTKYFGRSGTLAEGAPNFVPYVRWYSHLVADDRVPWADEVFQQIGDDWGRPYFFPSNSFVLPHCAPSDSIDPSRDWFPARGLFISAKGARTRLHADPWSSDALLCQAYGVKDFVMYDPAQAPYLTKGGRSVDVEAPDLQVFPDFPRARETARDKLQPGEILLVPAGWYHHFKSTSDSISLTWNFVHLCRLREFLSYLAAGPPETELKQLAFAYFGSPGRRPLDSDGFLATLTTSLGPHAPAHPPH